MGVLRDSGSTKFNLDSLGQPGAPGDELLEAVRETAAGEPTLPGTATTGSSWRCG